MLQSLNWGPIPISYIQYSLTLQMFLVIIAIVISILVVTAIIPNQLLAPSGALIAIPTYY